MVYELIYSKNSLKQLKKLNKQTRLRIISSFERVRIRPFSYIKKLVGVPYFRLRVGNYRIILDIKNNNFIILIL